MENLFVVFEGIDGSGKDTQCKALLKHLKKIGVKAQAFKYPTKKAKKIHEYLLGKKNAAQGEIFEEYLKDIMAGQDEIKGQLAAGWAVSDRYCISTAAYQGTGGMLEKRMEQIEMAGMKKADIALWLDISADEAMRRKGRQKILDKHEADFEFLKQVGLNYQKLFLASFMAKKWVRIDASKSEEEVFGQVKKALGI